MNVVRPCKSPSQRSTAQRWVFPLFASVIVAPRVNLALPRSAPPEQPLEVGELWPHIGRAGVVAVERVVIRSSRPLRLPGTAKLVSSTSWREEPETGSFIRFLSLFRPCYDGFSSLFRLAFLLLFSSGASFGFAGVTLTR